MNEDIKILESECHYLEELGYLRVNNHFIRFNQALEKLIKAYKELEEKNRKLKEHCKEQIKDKQELTTALLDSIPVSLVEEKIKEYEEKAKRIAGTYQYADSGDDLENKKKQVIELRTKSEGLKELLEGEQNGILGKDYKRI